jgi:hypothetical protein
MAGKLDPSELVSFKELLIANSIYVDALAQFQTTIPNCYLFLTFSTLKLEGLP